MITIMPICKADLEELRILYDNGFDGAATDFKKMNETYDLMKDNPNYMVLCAKYNGYIVGSLMGIICKEFIRDCKTFMVIENVIVSNECRRMGIGKMLMDNIENEAMKKGCSFLMLLSRVDRKGAHKFYESLGFNGDISRGFKKYL
ncbi:GNAT family N-acetyltransferase [Clostridium frigidicarnis]|uniref:Predicted N-acetyltransferase YhbS n=1 Tax=Clostridium frigidicarnis TaxID=84698 RepID=A0A1I0Y9A5_9CLOT|nr:GNAT family N-acetyltransferase [Clostridium frigidicarnis]SFB09985.1 Predicted N-acetyltransferase YhbS [Clostridium frigidicarnis]